MTISLRKIVGSLLCSIGRHLPGRFHVVVVDIERPINKHPIIQYRNQLICHRCGANMAAPAGQFKLHSIVAGVENGQVVWI